MQAEALALRESPDWAGAAQLLIDGCAHADGAAERTELLERLCDALGVRGLVFSRPGYGRSTPRPADEGCAATATACSRLAGPSAASAVPGRMAPVSTMGLALFTVRCRK